jgi:hypothetical protein
MRQDIEINIEEVRLHGFSHVDRYRIGQALQLELTRLITEQGLSQSLSQGGEFTQLDGGKFNIVRSSRAEVIGVQIAKSVYSRFSK